MKSQQINIRVDSELKSRLARVASKTGRGESELIRQGIDDLCRKYEGGRHIIEEEAEMTKKELVKKLRDSEGNDREEMLGRFFNSPVAKIIGRDPFKRGEFARDTGMTLSELGEWNIILNGE